MTDINKYQKALNNISIPLAQTDFIREHINDFKALKEVVNKYDDYVFRNQELSIEVESLKEELDTLHAIIENLEW